MKPIIHTYEFNVTRIVDGDTIDGDIRLGFYVILYKQRLRLYGIDTEESRTRDKIEKFYGKLAKSYLAEQAPIGSRIKLISHKKGKYGRVLASIYNDDSDISINEKMCMESLAVPYHGQSKEEIQDEHLVNRKKLREKGIVPPLPSGYTSA